MRNPTRLLAGSVVATAALAGAQTTELHKLTASDAEQGDEYGSAVALSETWIAVGDHDPGNDPHNWGAGRAYVYDTLTMSEYTMFSQPRSSAFGWSLDLVGNLLVVGVPQDDANNTNEGAVRTFSLGENEQVNYIQPEDPTSVQGFGRATTVHGVTLIAGAPSSYLSTGFAYATTLGGQQLTQFTHPDIMRDDDFGSAVAYDGEFAAISAPAHHLDGAPDAGAVFVYQAGTWDFVTKLTAPTPAEDAFFGGALAVADGLVFVGATREDDAGIDAGAVYVFDAATGALIDTLLPDPGSDGAWFGSSLAINDDRLLIGARFQPIDGAPTGAAYLYHADTRRFITKYLASDASANADFGRAVDLYEDRAIVGAPGHANPDGSTGAAYLFDAALAAPGDMNNDGCVDGVDLAILLANWGGSETDIDNDGVVATTDLAILLAAWGC